jgi:signal transduction histidine kinase/streptogramin lyase
VGEDPRVPHSLVGKLINEIYEDRSASLWISTAEGLYKLERHSGRLTHFKNVAADHGSLSSDLVYTVHQDMGGIMWVGTSNGLNELEPVTAKFYRHLPDTRVISIAEDRAGNLWMGTNGNGLSQLTKRAREFRTYTITGHESSRLYLARKASNGGLWGNPLQTDSLVYMDSTTRIQAWLFDGPEFYTFVPGRNRELWFQTVDKGIVLREKTGATTSFQFDRASDPTWPHFVQCIYEDSQGYFWVCVSTVGLVKFDPRSRTVVKQYRHHPSDSTSISTNDVTNVIEDGDHIFWVATTRGLNRFDPRTEKFSHWNHSPIDTTTFSSSIIQGLADGNDGSLWVGTSLGLNRFDKKTGKVRRFFRGNGTLSNYAFTVVRDRAGNVWVGYANNGLSKLDVRTGELTTFTQRDGLCGETFSNESMQRENGEIMLQGGVGSVVFHPDSIGPSAFIPRIVLTAFSVFDRSIILSEDSVGSYEPITMPYDSNFFSFEFISLDLTVPERNQHAYKLEGYEENWNYVGNKRVATYTKVPPGEYVFRVKGTNSDGIWSEKGTFINVAITPPWWKTTWAYLGYGFTTLAALYSIRRSEKKRDRLKQQAELERVESEKRLQQEFSKQLIESQETERKRVASELHDSLGQHLLIVNNELLLYQQGKGKNDPDIQRTTLIVKDAIKEVREIASNLHPHHLEKLGLRAAVEAMIEQISRSATVRFDAEIEDVDSALSMPAKINLYRILQEAIANIVRHSGATQASITVSRTDNTVQTTIQDNGKGFTPEASNGGGQVPPADAVRAGFGLKSMAERMSLIGGTITFDSAPAKGTTIKIAIPIHK